MQKPTFFGNWETGYTILITWLTVFILFMQPKRSSSHLLFSFSNTSNDQVELGRRVKLKPYLNPPPTLGKDLKC